MCYLCDDRVIGECWDSSGDVTGTCFRWGCDAVWMQFRRVSTGSLSDESGLPDMPIFSGVMIIGWHHWTQDWTGGMRWWIGWGKGMPAGNCTRGLLKDV